MDQTSDSFVDLNHARTKEQVEVMSQIQKDGVCPFCYEHFMKYHSKPIRKETNLWLFTENMSPYEGTKHHFIFVYKKKHVTRLDEIPSTEIAALFDLIGEVLKEYEIDGGAVLIRFGKMSRTGGSVDHLHTHLIVGGERSEDAESLKVKVGYKLTI